VDIAAVIASAPAVSTGRLWPHPK